MMYRVTGRQMSRPSFETSPIFGDVYSIDVAAYSFPEAVRRALIALDMDRNDIIICDDRTPLPDE